MGTKHTCSSTNDFFRAVGGAFAIPPINPNKMPTMRNNRCLSALHRVSKFTPHVPFKIPGWVASLSVPAKILHSQKLYDTPTPAPRAAPGFTSKQSISPPAAARDAPMSCPHTAACLLALPAYLSVASRADAHRVSLTIFRASSGRPPGRLLD